jgi:hypothetical protein
VIVTRLAPDVERATLRAEVRPGNRIEIETEGVVGFRVLLNDRIVDLDRTVVLRVNGDHVVSRIPTRSVRRVVDAVEALGDLSAVFPEVVDVDLGRR